MSEFRSMLREREASCEAEVGMPGAAVGPRHVIHAALIPNPIKLVVSAERTGYSRS